MELKLHGDTKRIRGMKLCHQMMRKFFQDDIVLVKYWGPVQMCVFYLEYEYTVDHYKIILECERGFLTITIKDQAGHVFSPWMIYPEARYYHYEDVDKDIHQLIQLTHKAIQKNQSLWNQVALGSYQKMWIGSKSCG